MGWILPILRRLEVLAPPNLTGNLMAGWRRQGDRSLLQPGARKSPRIVSLSRSLEPLRNLSERCPRLVRSAAR